MALNAPNFFSYVPMLEGVVKEVWGFKASFFCKDKPIHDRLLVSVRLKAK